MRASCAGCRFYSPTVSKVSALKYADGIGECRRNAPRGPVTFGWGGAGEPEHQHTAIMSPFPFVPADDWCGEFQPTGDPMTAAGKRGPSKPDPGMKGSTP